MFMTKYYIHCHGTYQSVVDCNTCKEEIFYNMQKLKEEFLHLGNCQTQDKRLLAKHNNRKCGAVHCINSSKLQQDVDRRANKICKLHCRYKQHQHELSKYKEPHCPIEYCECVPLEEKRICSGNCACKGNK